MTCVWKKLSGATLVAGGFEDKKKKKTSNLKIHYKAILELSVILHDLHMRMEFVQ